ncbi:MAG TPA: MgtC/SapB family protein [Puia sp.]|jgi:putative Mg2+ transporter-C (MgtC) family protein
MMQDIIWKLLLAVIVGGLIGAEREYRSKSAGFRTLTLICLGATLFTILSALIGGRSTPDRIASNVVVGIGFVGAGVIFKGDTFQTKVSGITTAAMIWVTAALGMAIGAGFEMIAFIACMLILGVLFIFSMLEGWIDKVNQIRNYKIVCAFENETLHRYEVLFTAHKLRFRRSRQTKSASDVITGEWVVQGTERNHRHFIHEILKDPSVKAFEF